MSEWPSQDALWEEARRDNVLIVGFAARTGLPAARLFEAHGVRYKISDHADRDTLAPLLEGLSVADEDVFYGPQDPQQLEGVTKILCSPGVPRSIELIVEARRRGIPVWADIDWLYPFFADKRIVAITGTDGKTTTTTLTGALLQTRYRVVVAGNIGVSVLGVYQAIRRADWLVLELSSFMLEELSRFRADLTTILNVAPDHVDRHPDLAGYAAVKQNIVRHARPEDLFVQNLDDELLAGFQPQHLRVHTMSRRQTAESHFTDSVFHVGGERYRWEDCRLQGQQNIPNILAALSIAHHAGVDADAARQTLADFTGLPHRLELVGRFAGVSAYDDSKASNVHAVDAALENFEEGVVLILGGRGKGLDFTPLRRHGRRLRCLVCYGEDGVKIRDALAFSSALYTYGFEDAVRLAAAQCRPGDVLLLSPGCTSWDQHSSYEERGDVFRALVPGCFS